MENKKHSISNARRRVQLDLKVVALSLSVISNKSGLLIESNCSRTAYYLDLVCG